MTNILITNAYSFYNKGDAAIIIGMLKTIRKIYPKAKISILSATPDIDEKYYAQYQAETYSRLLNWVGKNKPKIFSVPISVMKILWYLLWIKFAREQNRLLAQERVPSRQCL